MIKQNPLRHIKVSKRRCTFDKTFKNILVKGKKNNNILVKGKKEKHQI